MTQTLHHKIFRSIVADQFDQPLIENNLRGVFAEYLVAELLGDGWKVCRGTWNEWDIDGPNGEKIEVKSSSFLQTWTQDGLKRPDYKPSPVKFGIAERTRDWWLKPLSKPHRPAQVYVFALHAERDFAIADQRDIGQWMFYVLRSSQLPPGQKSISATALEALVEPVRGPRLSVKVEEAVSGLTA